MTIPQQSTSKEEGFERYDLPNGLVLFGAFHPSPRNVNTGRLNFEMMTDFLKIVKQEIN